MWVLRFVDQKQEQKKENADEKERKKPGVFSQFCFSESRLL